MMLRYLLEKEFKQIWRDRFLPKIIFIVPFLQLAILPFAADFEMKRINLAVVDHDRSSESVRLVEKALASGYFVDAGRYVTYDEALTSVEGDRSDIILEIPPHFERDLTRGEPVRLMIAANAVNGTKGGLGSAYLTRIVQDYGAGLSGLDLMPEGPMLSVSVTNLYNPHLNYKVYMVPGIIVFLVTIIGGALSSLNIVSEKEKGTIEQMNVSPIPKWLFLLSKLIPFWVLGFGLADLRLVASGELWGHLCLRRDLSPGVYGDRLGGFLDLVVAAAGDVHHLLLPDHLRPLERSLYADQQHAGVGEDSDAV